MQQEISQKATKATKEMRLWFVSVPNAYYDQLRTRAALLKLLDRKTRERLPFVEFRVRSVRVALNDYQKACAHGGLLPKRYSVPILKSKGLVS